MLRLALPLIGCLFDGARAYPSYVGKFPNGGSAKDCDGQSAVIGHIKTSGGGPRNQFGIDYTKMGRGWTQELCNADSDGDGWTNGQELGDPECNWTVGDIPQFDAGITHPGLNCADRICPNTNGTRAKKRDEDQPLGCADYEHETTVALDVLMPGYLVGEGTSYVKKAFTLQEGGVDLAATKFEFVKDQPKVVHHMLLYGCAQDMSGEYGDPKADHKMGGGCVEVKMAWAVGGQDFCVPRETAFIAEAGSHFILEIHYDNPTNMEGVIDNSGMIIHGVPNEGSGLTPASVILMGSRLPAVTVPPGKKLHRASAPITSEMMELIPDGTEVSVFAYIHHMHQIGVQQWLSETSNETGNATGDDIACITNYDFDLQEAISIAPRTLTRDMQLSLECVWDSSGRDWETVGGDATENEMCIIILFVRPALPAGFKLGHFLAWNLEFSDEPVEKICGCPNGNEGGTIDPAPIGWNTRALFYHGIAMIAAWGFLMPFGATFPLCWRSALGAPRWLQLHQAFQITGMLVSVVGFYLAFSVTESHFDLRGGPHGMIGLVITVAAIVQLGAAAWRPDAAHDGEKPTGCRNIWQFSHRAIAVVALLGSIPQIMFGAFKFDAYETGLVSSTQFLAALGVCWVITIIFAICGCSRAPAPTSYGEQEDDVEITQR